MRQLYLRYGPHTILDCSFCHPDYPLTYGIYHLPTNILFPHLFNLLAIGLSTSRSISGPGPSHFRTKSTLGAIALLTLDLLITNLYELRNDSSTISPTSLYAHTVILRPLILAIFNISLAFLIYASLTSRFIFFPFLASASDASNPNNADIQALSSQTQKLLNDATLSVQMTHMKLRGLNVTKNAIVRDRILKEEESRYWEQVRRMERSSGGLDDDDEGGIVRGLDQSVFEDEEVQSAVARAFGSGNVDVGRMRTEAEGFVREVTRGLD